MKIYFAFDLSDRLVTYDLTKAQQDDPVEENVYEILTNAFSDSGVSLPDNAFVRVADYDLRDESEMAHGWSVISPLMIVYEVSGLSDDDGIMMMMKHNAYTTQPKIICGRIEL